MKNFLALLVGVTVFANIGNAQFGKLIPPSIKVPDKLIKNYAGVIYLDIYVSHRGIIFDWEIADIRTWNTSKKNSVRQEY